MTISLQSNNRYIVTNFEEKHNHELVSPSKTHLIRSHRKINVVQTVEIDLASKSGLNPKETYEFMSRQAGGRENLGFIPIDLQNYLQKRRQYDMELGEAGSLLYYFQKNQTENSSFQYSIQLDSDDQITNIFWCDSKMRMDYEQFGDVVTFDTTYRINREGKPFAPFVGVNNHRETVVFGAALMYDETKNSFKWVFESFLRVMYGKEPKTIITDQDHAMRSAIPLVFKETKHRICLWHLYLNVGKQLGHIFQHSSTFAQELQKCIYDFEEEEEFLEAWENMLDKYNLIENTWLQQTFNEREKWAMVYGKQTFCADMKSTQLSESFNSKLKRYLNSKLDILRFFEHFERVLDDVRYKELVSNYDMTQKIPRLKVNAMLLRQARDVYTAKVFEWFQKEYELATNLVVSHVENNGAITVYKVCMFGKNNEHKVTFNSLDDTISCSCLKYEFVGILCRHVLRVFERQDVKIIPSKYIMKRWTKEASLVVGRSYEKPTEGEASKLSMLNRYKDLSRIANSLAKIASLDEEDYEYFRRHLEEAKSKLGKRMNVEKNLNSDTGNDLSQPDTKNDLSQLDTRNDLSQLELGEEGRKLLAAKGMKAKNGGIRGGPRPKNALETGSKRRRNNNVKVAEQANTTSTTQRINNNGSNLEGSFSSVFEQSNAWFGQGSSTFIYYHPPNMPANTYMRNGTQGSIHGNPYFSSYSHLLQAMNMNREIQFPYPQDYTRRGHF